MYNVQSWWSNPVFTHTSTSSQTGAVEVLDPVLPKALPRVWPREPSFQLELEVMTGQAEHPLGQCMRQGHVVGETQVREARGGEGRCQGGATGAGHWQCHWEEVPSS